MVTEKVEGVVGCNGFVLPDEPPDGYSPEPPPRRLTPEEMLRQEEVGRLVEEFKKAAASALAKHRGGQITTEDLERIVNGVDRVAFELRTFHNSVSYQEKPKS